MILRPKNCNIEIRGLKHHGIKKQRHLSHDIVIPRHFVRGQIAMTLIFQSWKTATLRYQDQKATTVSFCGVLTLMLSDTYLTPVPSLTLLLFKAALRSMHYSGCYRCIHIHFNWRPFIFHCRMTYNKSLFDWVQYIFALV